LSIYSKALLSDSTWPCVSIEYRSRHARLLALLQDGESGWQPLYQVLRYRRRSLDQSKRQLEELQRQGQLERDISDLLRSYVPLRCNRLLGRDPEVERRAMGLLFRTYKGVTAKSVQSEGKNPGVSRAGRQGVGGASPLR
jgi:hypothetical protein